jgi:hypothetical protein
MLLEAISDELQESPGQAPRIIVRWRPMRAISRLSPTMTAALAILVAACGGSDPAPQPEAQRGGDPGPIHVHGLGVDPADGSLFVATHTGLFRASAGERSAVRVGERYQDTMGFTVIGPNRFLGSGHPDGRESLPPFLGLIESRDAGKSWQSISLQGEVDFHVLEASGSHVYGFGSDFESREPRFLTSSDGGRTWDRREAPEPLLALAISPNEPEEIVASGEQFMYRSSDGGRRWRQVDAPAAGLLTWNARGLFLATADGRVFRADAAGGRWSPSDEGVGEAPAAMDSGLDGELLVALHDGVIKQSKDSGASWTVRSEPD